MQSSNLFDTHVYTGMLFTKYKGKIRVFAIYLRVSTYPLLSLIMHWVTINFKLTPGTCSNVIGENVEESFRRDIRRTKGLSTNAENPNYKESLNPNSLRSVLH
jgi:hypothetical protein